MRPRALAAAALIGGLIASAAPQPATATPQPAAAAQLAPAGLDWKHCGKTLRKQPLECARIRVPLDYGKPRGRKIVLGVTKLQLPGAKGRPIFINGGGPGIPGDGLLRYGPSPVPTSVSKRRPILAMDPRGLPHSTPLNCLRPGRLQAILAALSQIPLTADAQQATYSTFRGIGSDCRSTHRRLYGHMGSVATARDLDRLRKAAGAQRLDYVGVSYGTYLGSVYSSLFPQRVGRMVLGAVVHPGYDWRQLVELQVKGFQAGIEEWASTCPQRSTCPFPGQDPMAGLLALIAALDANPATLGGGPYSGQDLVGDLQISLFNGDSAAGIDRTVTDAKDLQSSAAALHGRLRRAAQSGSVSADGVTVTVPTTWATRCTDWPTAALDFSGIVALADSWRGRYPVFGYRNSWLVTPCGHWPGSRKHPRRVRQTTQATPLLVSGLHDPATPLPGARAMARTFGSSRLVTWDGYGHGVLESGDCDRTVADFVLRGRLPARGSTCR